MKKLLLEEDDIVIDNKQDTPNVSDIEISNLISQMIRSEWDSVDLYNSMLLNFKDQQRDELSGIIDEIVTDHYANIGQLEKALQILNSSAQGIDGGKSEAEDLEFLES